MFHTDHCNHSCTSDANHSCVLPCNDSYMDNETLASRIKAIRNAAKDSLAEAGKKVGVSRQAFDKWEKGDTENMKLGNLLRFCDRYRVNLEALIRGNDNELWRRVTPPTSPVLIALDPSSERDQRQSSTLTNDQQIILSGFSLAGDETKKIMLQIAEGVIQDFERRGETN